ncbi:heparinase II/III domain-containing protein [Vreelandella venusta]|uniref:heparinase II/III domain-containing protein n=1 Tax=Vreelandella venusta TaxID=44935 RepID=UPI003F66E1C9
MATKNLLACATTGATKYIQKAVNPKNKLDYQKLKKLFDEHQFVTNNFDDTELNLITFDWQSLERDRNWWWQLQALPFLNWYVNSLELQTEEERTRYLSVCLDAIHGWIKNAKQNKESPLVWHDHASAFRARNITNWLLFCDTAGLWLKEESRIDPFANLIIEHLDWLQEDKHYSKHTNHGFDQAMIALTISLMFARDDFELYRQCNRARLKDEVTFAFTDEGVHKENSPGYQKMMLGRLKQLRTLSPLGEQEISQMGELYIEKAEAFLRAITLPNGYLPMIGDTKGGEVGLLNNDSLKKGIDVFDYSRSGYVIVKGNSEKVGEFYFLIKNCHFSNYHRHDDDLMIFLWSNGDVILGDGGLYSHNEKDEIRKFLRSNLAHTTVFFKKRPIRDKSILSNAPSVSVDKNKKTIFAKSYMFDVEVTRVIDYSSIQDGSVFIKDKSTLEPVFLNFYFGGFSEVKLVKRDLVKINFLSSFCKIISNARFYGLYKGGSENISEVSYMSSKYGVADENLRIVLTAPSKNVEHTIEFGLLEQ